MVIRHTAGVTVTILQLGDVHIAADPGTQVHDRDPAHELGRVLDAWAATREVADLVLLTGDLTEDGSPAGCERLAAAMRSVDAPVLALPGNHDDPAAVAQVFGPTTHVDVGSWRVLGVDSSVPGEVHGAVDADDVAARLDALDDRPTIVAVHHPPLSPSTHPWFQLDGAAALLDRLAARPHVRAVVTAHLHEPFERQPDRGPVVLGCPSTLAAIEHRRDTYRIAPERPTGARVLDLADDGSFTSRLLEVEPA